MKFVEFELVEANSGALISLDPKFVELVVDVSKIQHQLACTQITMTSGIKFFVKHSYKEVIEKILNN